MNYYNNNVRCELAPKLQKYWPLTLQFVTLVYNALVHSATGKIPYAQIL